MIDEISCKHTSLPWRTEAVSDAVRIVVGTGRSKVIIAKLNPKQLPEKETKANAEFIVRACSCHDELVGIAKFAIHAIRNSSVLCPEQLISKIQEALDKAESKQQELQIVKG